MTTFRTSPALARALVDKNYSEPTPVQAAVLTEEVLGRDLLVSAQTGSGKTVAYGLAIGPQVLGDSEALAPAETPLALVIAPTRELALQVERELAWLYAAAKARIVSCVGGMDPKRERRLLADGAHVVVGTPGRLRDHLERGALKVEGLRAVVLDEADEMLDLGFREDLEFILEATPAERRTLLFSATMPKGIVALARSYQREARRIEVAGGERGHADIDYRAIRVAPREVEPAVLNLLRLVDAPAAMVFCNTREAVRHLHAFLVERGFGAVLLSGELGQHERNQALQAMRDGRARVCVATDVAARGIDLPHVGLVIHADLPHDAEALQHRSGRTGRAGRKGISALLVPPARRRRAEQMLAVAGIRPSWAGPPTAEEIRELDRERLLKDPLLIETAGEEDMAFGRELLARYSAETIAAALAKLCRERLPGAEEVFDPGEQERRPRLETRQTRGEEGPALQGQIGGVWFRLSVGRRNNADPKWLLPMLCRRGKIKRSEVGAIRIFDQESAVEIAAAAADGFEVGVRVPDEENIRIVRHDGTAPQEEQRSYRKGPRSFGGKADRFKGGDDRPERQSKGGEERSERRGKPRR